MRRGYRDKGTRNMEIRARAWSVARRGREIWSDQGTIRVL